MQKFKTFIESHSFSSRAISSVLFVRNGEIFFELFNAISGNLCVSLFVLTDLIIFAVCHLYKFSPFGTNPIDKLLVFRLNLVLVHFKYTELFLSLNYFEFHIHGSVFDLSDYIQKGFDKFNSVHWLLKQILVGFDLFDNS